MQSLVQPLSEGPIDLVGDVHGEIEALLKLRLRFRHYQGPSSFDVSGLGI
jgi:hypothetical protein